MDHRARRILDMNQRQAVCSVTNNGHPAFRQLRKHLRRERLPGAIYGRQVKRGELSTRREQLSTHARTDTRESRWPGREGRAVTHDLVFEVVGAADREEEGAARQL